MVMTLNQIIILHFFIGVGFCGFIGFICLQKDWHRWPLIFGNSSLLGEKSYWIGWLLGSYLWETLSSILAHDFYREIKLSPVEAIAITFGAFVADRILCLFEPSVPSVHQAHHQRTRLTSTVRSLRAWWIKTKPMEPEVVSHPHMSEKDKYVAQNHDVRQEKIDRMREMLKQ